jgi:hypothetical protein
MTKSRLIALVDPGSKTAAVALFERLVSDKYVSRRHRRVLNILYRLCSLLSCYILDIII